jgi:hypothetical protein
MERTLSILLFFNFLLFSCTRENNENAATSKTDTAKTNNTFADPAIPVIQDTISPHSITQSEIPPGVSFNGDLYNTYSWYDKNGRNILVLSTRSYSVTDKEFGGEEKTKELMAKLFVKRPGSTPELLWNLYDVQKKCLFDLTLDLVTSPDICDSDNNGVKEVYILYKTSCRSDAYPSDMKLIGHEGKQKFALRGLMVFRFNDFPDSLFTDDRELDLSKIPEAELKNTAMRNYGCYENANNLKNVNSAIMEHAKIYWRNNIMEN